MNEGKKRVKQGDTEVYNTQAIFARVMCLLSAGQINLEDIFKYELAPVPTSLFDETGDGRYAKQKADLKNKLKFEETCRNKEFS